MTTDDQRSIACVVCTNNNLGCWNELQAHTCGIDFVMTNPFDDDDECVNTSIEGGPIDNDNKDDDSDSEVDEEDLDALLNDMDIDKDFSMWKNFRASVSSDAGDVNVALKQQDNDSQEEEEAKRIQFWKDRLHREEVYSKRYHPSKGEKKELQEVAVFVGLSKRSGSFLARASTVLTGESGNMNLVQQLLQPGEEHPKSILLKRGPVLWKDQECELILLTHGFILATAQESSKAKHNTSFMFVQRTYETCQLWDQVDHATNLPEKNCSFGVVCKDESLLWEFQVDSAMSHTAWLHAMETVLVQHALHSKTYDTSQYGWQYQLMHRPGYTAVVTGNVDVIGTSSSGDNFNSLDIYQRMAPLHYALKQEKCSIPIIEALLMEGADPNFPDEDGRTAMYYGAY
jgi:hypothetical protein